MTEVLRVGRNGWFALLVVAIAAGFAVGFPAVISRGADHLDAPLVQADGRLDINDVYAFTRDSSTVLVMTVNPLAGVLSPPTFHPKAKYEFLIDNNGDAKDDLRYRFEFSEPDGSMQQDVKLRQMGGPLNASGTTGQDISLSNGGMLRADLFDDPFFFDLIAFQNGLAFCLPSGNPNSNSGIDFFAGFDVSAIVLEVPTADLVGGSSSIGVWARIVVDGKQIERMGRPVINTVLIPSSSKDAFNATKPVDDVAEWSDEVIASLISLNGDADYSAAVATVLLPDILTLDTDTPSGFLNGRTLSDDVIDIVLSVVSNGAIASDCVAANDVPFPSAFPYLAPAH